MGYLRSPGVFIHTFPRTYDDDYYLYPMISQDNNAAQAVDNSRTLRSLGRSMPRFIGSCTYEHDTGGNE
jgi:hypothetical protein